MLAKGTRATDRSRPAETSKERLQAYKWLEVMKFMQMNPHVLMQMLTIQERRHLRQQHEERLQFFSKRKPRYTDKILNQINQGLPGLIGTMQSSSNPPVNRMQNRVAPPVILAHASNERSKKKISPVLAHSKQHGRKGKQARDVSHESEAAPSI